MGRERDFARIVANKRDLWTLTEFVRNAGVVLGLDIPPDLHDGVKPCLQKFKYWLQQELGRIPGAIDLGMTSRWPVFDRLVHLISVSPGFEFIMGKKVQPNLLQPKYVLMISRSGQVRIAWYAYVQDKIMPGATAGPFVVKLVSEDLNAERDRSYTIFQYTAKATGESDMEKILAA